jgi:MoaA/NifB/PqqE/SkfB family radical SAM enzyme
VILLGGEPLMVPWLIDLMEEFPKVAFLLFTNGLLFDDDKIARVAKMGNVAVSVAVDGLEEETDRRRGQGAFQGAVGALRKLSDAGVFVGYSTMISRQNFDEVYSDAFLDTMIEAGASFTWMPTTLPLGRACREHHIIPTPEQKAQVRGRLTETRRKKPLLFMDFSTIPSSPRAAARAGSSCTSTPTATWSPAFSFLTPWTTSGTKASPRSSNRRFSPACAG